MDCSYCGRQLKKGRGLAYVYTRGKISYFCSSRCYKNGAVLHRKFNKKELVQKPKA